MYIVTGGAGFVGSNLVAGLNALGHKDIIVVDDLTDGKKFSNIAHLDILDYIDFEQLFAKTNHLANFSNSIKAVFHQGACSITTHWDGRYMMENNYQYSKDLLHACLKQKVPFIYASSAAVYGNSMHFEESRENENALNIYAYSKLLFDRYASKFFNNSNSQITGLRYFNVYGPYESHKGKMASVAYQFMNQLHETNKINLFEGADGFGNGEQQRDFIHIDDVIKVNLWFLNNPSVSGLYNVGTGRCRSFNDIAKILINCHQAGKIMYIPFPESLKGSYQSYTQANIRSLRNIGYQESFMSLEDGLSHYYDWYQNHIQHNLNR